MHLTDDMVPLQNVNGKGVEEAVKEKNHEEAE